MGCWCRRWAAESVAPSQRPSTVRRQPADPDFLHVRSPEPDALPLIITHGGLGSIAEFFRCRRPGRGTSVIA
jgi:hypothetical protein